MQIFFTQELHFVVWYSEKLLYLHCNGIMLFPPFLIGVATKLHLKLFDCYTRCICESQLQFTSKDKATSETGLMPVKNK